MPVVEVAVPDGCYTGDVFTVTSGEQQLDVTVPEGCGPGMLLAVELPDEPGASGGGEETLEVEIPAGCGVDSSFLVALPDGREIEITVPVRQLQSTHPEAHPCARALVRSPRGRRLEIAHRRTAAARV